GGAPARRAGASPPARRRRVPGGRKPMTERPGATLPPADFAATRQKLEKQTGQEVTDRDVITHLLYPRVHADFLAHQATYADVSVLPTPVFFYGMEKGEEIGVDI